MFQRDTSQDSHHVLVLLTWRLWRDPWGGWRKHVAGGGRACEESGCAPAPAWSPPGPFLSLVTALLRYDSHPIHFPCLKYIPVVLASSQLCNCHHYLIPGHCHHPKNPFSFGNQPSPPPPICGITDLTVSVSREPFLAGRVAPKGLWVGRLRALLPLPVGIVGAAGQGLSSARPQLQLNHKPESPWLEKRMPWVRGMSLWHHIGLSPLFPGLAAQVRVDGSQDAHLYETVPVVDGSRILRDLLFSPDHRHIYLLSEKQVGPWWEEAGGSVGARWVLTRLSPGEPAPSGDL